MDAVLKGVLHLARHHEVGRADGQGACLTQPNQYIINTV